MIPETVVEQVRDRADIVETVGEHLSLKRAGKDFKALCPFHQEKTPSFYVVPAKGFFKCFGCGESGDVFTFLMKRQGLTFIEAVKQVADRVGVEIPESGPARREDEAHRPLYEAIAFAADFFAQHLAEGGGGERARRYLEGRGIERAAIERFRIGYAPADWRALRDAAHRHGISDEVLLDAGLIKASERGGEPYDRFRDRVIFPIPDVGGRIVAFGGRVLGGETQGAPKYLNSPESAVYHKGRLLYGVYWAKGAIRREESALVVEGYMDYVSLAARGIENVVAGLGTAMTQEQAALLARYTGKALLLYDSDTAGLRATFRTGDVLLREGVHPLVVSMPPGEDPDSVVRSGGAAALKRYLDDAADVLDRKLRILEERGYFADIDGVRKSLDGVLPTLRSVVDPALRDIYIARVAERTGVRPETLRAEVDKAPRTQPEPPPEPAPRQLDARLGERRRRERRKQPPGEAGERKLILLLLRDNARIAAAVQEVEPEDFGDPGYRTLFERLAAGADPRDELETLGEPAVERLQELLAEREELNDADKIFADCVRDIRVERLFRSKDELMALIDTARLREDEGELARLTGELSRLIQQMQSFAHQAEGVARKSQKRSRRVQ